MSIATIPRDSAKKLNLYQVALWLFIREGKYTISVIKIKYSYAAENTSLF